MSRRILWIVALGAATASAGVACQSTRAVGDRVVRFFEGEEYIRVTLDDQVAQQQAVKKLVPGWSKWRVNEPVSCSPTLIYRITKPERLGRITYVRAAIHRAFDVDYSSQPDYSIVARDPGDAESQLKPNRRYDLSAPEEAIRILDITGREVSSIQLDPGTEYQLILTLTADKSQTAVVYFTTA